MMDDKDIRVELMATARDQDEAIANMVATAAFFVMKNGWLAAPGVVFPDQVSMYFPETTTPHIMWDFPPVRELASMSVSGFGPVHWLRAIPITSAERDLLSESGHEALTTRLMNAEIDYFDLTRSSVV